MKKFIVAFILSMATVTANGQMPPGGPPPVPENITDKSVVGYEMPTDWTMTFWASISGMANTNYIMHVDVYEAGSSAQFGAAAPHYSSAGIPITTNNNGTGLSGYQSWGGMPVPTTTPGLWYVYIKLYRNGNLVAEASTYCYPTRGY